MQAEHKGGPVTFVNRFTVHSSREEFEAVFAETAAFMAAQPGFVEHTLLVHTGSANAFINIAQWEDEQSFRAALAHPSFAEHAAALRALSTSEPDLYRTCQHRSAVAGAER